MKLTVLERMALLHALPQEGNFATLKIVRKLREDLSFSEAEYKAWGIEELPNGRMSWKVNEEKELEFGEKATDIIVASLKKLNETDKLTVDHLSVYEKFVKE
jgi:hypothetical protein